MDNHELTGKIFDAVDRVLAHHPEIQMVGDTYPIVVEEHRDANILYHELRAELATYPDLINADCAIYDLSEPDEEGPFGISVDDFINGIHIP